MSRREIVERSLVGVAAVTCLLLALALGAARPRRRREPVGAVGRRRRVSDHAGDDRVVASKDARPVRSRRELLGTEDDVEMRRAVRSVRLARLDDPTVSVSDPERRAASQRRPGATRCDRRGREGPKQRSRAAGLLGVLGLARLVSETQDRVALLSATVANLQLAIALDPSNDDAKYNLELALQRARGIQLTEGAGGQNPSPGGSGSSGAGAGDPGSGY